ncbi:hypothetical protein KY348_02250 [Candidatus Woesearchaeota archaeon]|nr:hypothetical protein [Candidatus Woesearchaeota archaeon]
MDKKARIALITALVLVAILVISLAVAKPGGRAKKECMDGIDNDGDGDIDLADAGCDNKQDNDESNCGDDVCEGEEDCDNCAADCLDIGQVCCNGTAYTGDCCDDNDCTPPATCISHVCTIEDSCSDTDGGIVIGTFGTTSGYLNEVPYSNDDYCVDAGNVMEYYCTGDYEYSTQESCGTDFYGSNYCDSGDVYRDFTDYFCSSGVCDSSVTPELVEDCTGAEVCLDGECVIPDSCSDTDGGWDTLTQGTASGYLSETYYEDTDYCIDSTNLREYYCIGDYEYYSDWDCSMNITTSCNNGACV